ncbi:dynein axonemal heavy chain 12-like, partial [Phyllobates terribilis]
PATVSRCGMIYLEPQQLGWAPLVRSWLSTLPDALKTKDHLALLEELFKWLVQPSLRFLRKQCKDLVTTSNGNVVISLTPLLEMLIFDVVREDLNNKNIRIWIMASFAFSLVWSIGGCCDTDSRVKFDAFFKEIVTGKIDQSPFLSSVGKWECPLDDKGQVYDYMYEVKGFLGTRFIEIKPNAQQLITGLWVIILGLLGHVHTVFMPYIYDFARGSD